MSDNIGEHISGYDIVPGFKGPEFEQHEIPAKMLLYPALVNRVSGLTNQFVAECLIAEGVPEQKATKYLKESIEAVVVHFDSTKSCLFTDFGADALKLEYAQHPYLHSSALVCGITLIADGSPYIMDNDLENDPYIQEYNVVFSPENPPFLVAPYELDELSRKAGCNIQLDRETDMKNIHQLSLTSTAEAYLVRLQERGESPRWLSDIGAQQLLDAIMTTTYDEKMLRSDFEYFEREFDEQEQIGL